MKNYIRDASFYKERPIVLLSNSSWYLNHYRKNLIEEIVKKEMKPILMAPYDNFSSELSSKAIYIPWRISRSKNFNLIVLLIAFFRLFFLIRAIKPGIIHSHTIKPNILSSLVSSFFGIPLVISFAGLGRLSSIDGRKKILLKFIFNFITFFSTRQRCSRFKWESNFNRTSIIFQNPEDLKIFKKLVGKKSDFLDLKLILGSGVPKKYINSRKNVLYYHPTPYENINVIFCARLLKSKGIDIFIELGKRLPHLNFNIYGDIDIFSSDSLTKKEIDNAEEFPNIFFHGFKKDPLLKHLKDPAILMVPSLYGEGLPRSIPEAMTLGIPVAASLKSCCGIFTDNFLEQVENHNVEEYEKTINKIINKFWKINLLKKLENSRIYAEENLSESFIVKNTIEIYEKFYKGKQFPYVINNF